MTTKVIIILITAVSILFMNMLYIVFYKVLGNFDEIINNFLHSKILFFK